MFQTILYVFECKDIHSFRKNNFHAVSSLCKTYQPYFPNILKQPLYKEMSILSDISHWRRFADLFYSAWLLEFEKNLNLNLY